MIENLTTYPRPLPNNPMVVEDVGMDNKSLFDKINELVDTVNILQESLQGVVNNQIKDGGYIATLKEQVNK